ncbi:unnamed protein product, partial [Polarella glacialis]
FGISDRSFGSEDLPPLAIDVVVAAGGMLTILACGMPYCEACGTSRELRACRDALEMCGRKTQLAEVTLFGEQQQALEEWAKTWWREALAVFLTWLVVVGLRFGMDFTWPHPLSGPVGLWVAVRFGLFLAASAHLAAGGLLVIHLSRGMALALDGFTCRYVERLDSPAVSKALFDARLEWTKLSAALRSTSVSLQKCFATLVLSIFASLMDSWLWSVPSGSVNGLTVRVASIWRLLPGIALALAILRRGAFDERLVQDELLTELPQVMCKPRIELASALGAMLSGSLLQALPTHLGPSWSRQREQSVKLRPSSAGAECLQSMKCYVLLRACQYGGGQVLSDGPQQKYGEFLFSRLLYDHGYEVPLRTLRNPLGGKAKRAVNLLLRGAPQKTTPAMLTVQQVLDGMYGKALLAVYAKSIGWDKLVTFQSWGECQRRLLSARHRRPQIRAKQQAHHDLGRVRQQSFQDGDDLRAGSKVSTSSAVQVHIRALSGKVSSFTFPADALVRDVKTAALVLFPGVVSLAQVRLLCKGKQLSDDWMLEQCAISTCSTLHALLELRGGGGRGDGQEPLLPERGSGSNPEAPGSVREGPSQEGAGVQAAGGLLPVEECRRCSSLEHLTADCPHYHGEREPHADVQLGDNMRHLRQIDATQEGELCVIEGRHYFVGRASGKNNNCLIDTLRQVFGVVVGDFSWIRSELRKRYPAGPHRVTRSNFLELDPRWRDVVKLLSVAAVNLEKGQSLDPSRFRIICVDFDYPGHGDVVGTGERTPCIGRVNENHFPLQQLRRMEVLLAACAEKGLRRRASAPEPKGERRDPTLRSIRPLLLPEQRPERMPKPLRLPHRVEAPPARLARDGQAGGRRDGPPPPKGFPSLASIIARLARGGQAAGRRDGLPAPKGFPSLASIIVPPNLGPARKGEAAGSKADEGEQEEEEEEADETEELSEEDGDDESDASDIFHVEVLPDKTWETPEDRRLRAVQELAAHLRELPLLPPHPQDPTRAWKDVRSGIKLPAAHCAFRGCGWTGERSDTIPQHLAQSHREMLEDCLSHADGLGEENKDEEHGQDSEGVDDRSGSPEDSGAESGGESESLGGQAEGGGRRAAENGVSHGRCQRFQAFYTAAIREIERRGAPTLGASVDRRAFQHLREVYSDGAVRSLICFVCAQVKTRTLSPNSDIDFVRGKWLRRLSDDSFDDNLSFPVFERRYASMPPLQRTAELAPGTWEWKRRCRRDSEELVEVICCPEDVTCAAQRPASDVCDRCQLPVCRNCRLIMRRRDAAASKVPMALASDNFIGYLPKMIYDLKVRWIEAAVACPCWTMQTLYYLEGDRGHLLEEEVFNQKARTGVRGNIFSFHMPWEDIIGSLEGAVGNEELVSPHPPSVLCHLVKLHMRVASVELAPHIRDMKVRAHVVLKLGYYFIEQRRPAFRKGNTTVALLKTRFKAAVERLYPCSAEEQLLPEEQRQGVIPAELVDIMRLSIKQRLPRGPLFDKNATPAEGPREPGDVFAHVRPQAVLLERTSDSGGEPNAQCAAALNQYSELQVQTGSEFVEQWNPLYPSLAFPLTLPFPVGGPEFKESQRGRRHETAARVTPFQYVKGIARRCEGQIQNSWDFLPAIRNLYHRWTVLNTPGLRVQRTLTVAESPAPSEASAAELTSAASSLYDKLWQGTFGDVRRPRLIAGDATKLEFAHNLSKVERELVKNMNFKASHLPGVQQIRVNMGHCCFGMRIVYGEGLFLTISPSERHSGLALRLLRYRRNDPILDADERWEQYPQLMSADQPSLEESAREGDEIIVELPEYEFRRLVLAKQPLSVVDAFCVGCKIVLPRALGFRMCPLCPHCNADGSLHPCQDEFGSNMMPMGGILGGCETIGGAVEYQRLGEPHFHGLPAVVSVFQHNTWAGVARLIEARLLDVEAVKAFQSWLFRVEHFDQKAHEADIGALEKQWPQFGDRSHDPLARLPRYVAAVDRAPPLGTPAAENRWLARAAEKRQAMRSVLRLAGVSAKLCRTTILVDLVAEFAEETREGRERIFCFDWLLLLREAVTYQSTYYRDVQFVFSRAQRHIHKAGQDAKKQLFEQQRHKLCKARLPKKKQLTIEAKLVCPGVAQKHDLRVSGRRNALCSILGKRGCVWFSGTAPGLAACLRCNTNTSPNFRVPLMPQTHEPSCEKDCLQKAPSVKKVCLIAQRALKQLTGYFAGYTCKRQPIGKYELQQSQQSLNFLQQKMQTESRGVQVSKVTNRMLSDLEGKGTLRTAAEEVNLAANMNENDVMDAEFIRTFRTQDFYGQRLLARLQLEQRRRDDQRQNAWLPVRRVQKPGDNVLFYPYAEAYGFRPQDNRVWYLSPWEFSMLWRAVQLHPPCHPLCRGRTKWTKEGRRFYTERKDDDPPVELIAGRRYRVVEQRHAKQMPYSDLPQLEQFRQHWLLVRHERPVTPAPQHTPLPRQKNMSVQERGKLFAVYLCPWTLLPQYSSEHVPAIQDLDVVPVDADIEPAERRLHIRLKGKQAPPPGYEQRSADGRVIARSFSKAWRRYIRGRVVSEHVKQIIVNFLGACLAHGRKEDEPEADVAAQDDDQVAALGELPLRRLHQLLKPREVDQGEGEEVGKISATVAKSVNFIHTIWGDEEPGEDQLEAEEPATRPRKRRASALDCSGHRTVFHGTGGDKQNAAGDASPHEDTDEDMDDEEEDERKPAVRPAKGACVHRPNGRKSARDWFAKLDGQQPGPNSEQLVWLREIDARCQVEAREDLDGQINRTRQEPFRKLCHGLPGSGKSRIIHWARQYFEEVWGWKHGNEFVFVALMNTMAALIAGMTVHSFGGIGMGAEQGASKQEQEWSTPSISKMWSKLQRLRWLFCDEVEAVSAELLAALEANVTDAFRKEGTYAVRTGPARADRTKRPFGGLNVGFFGDLWQLPPVAGTPVFHNPFAAKEHRVQRMLAMFWGRGEDSLAGTLELTQQIRCTDAWLREVLRECRDGDQSWTMYNFVHGYPTAVAGSWSSETGTPTCGVARCPELQTRIWPDMAKTGSRDWGVMRAMECDACKAERERRRLVLRLEDRTHEQEPFVSAPFVTPYNQPKYSALQYRAMKFAKAHNRQLLWIKAWDKPLAKEDRALRGEALERQRLHWLRFHDQQTAGIMGLLPAVRELPVRFTETCLCVYLPEATWTVKSSLGPGVYPLKPVFRTWSRDAAGLAKVRRWGFPLVVDLSGTAHSYIGSTLKAAVVDSMSMQRKPKREDALKGYQCLSRPGPRLLMRFQRGELEETELEPAWAKLLLWRCCVREKEKLYSGYGVSDDRRFGQDYLRCVLEPGDWRVCVACKSKGRGLLGRAAVYKTQVECSLCKKSKPESAFDAERLEAWRKNFHLTRAVCRECEAAKDEESTEVECSCCKESKPEDAFDAERLKTWRKNRHLGNAVCRACEAAKKEYLCKTSKPEDAFDAERLETWRGNFHLTRAVCIDCEAVKKEESTEVECSLCKKSKPEDAFDAERLEMWRKNFHLTRAVCRDCEATKEEASGQSFVKCSTCEVDLPTESFDAERLDAWRGNRHLARAVCRGCDAGKEKSEQNRLTCSTCKVGLPTDCFDAERLETSCRNSNLAGAICRECEAKANLEERLLTCSTCKELLPLGSFDPVRMMTWRANNHLSRAVCKDCQGSLRGLSSAPRASGISVQCRDCKLKLDCTMFDNKSLAQWIQQQELWKASCLQCRPLNKPHLHKQSYACSRRKEQKPLAAFSVVVQKGNNLSRWRCLDCQFPKCATCGRQRAQPMTHTFTHGSYFCAACGWPPCSGGCGAPRPQDSRFHVQKKAQWFCVKCRVDADA